MKIICISGIARSGKDTLADILQHILKYEYNKKVLIVHNADLVKYSAKMFLNWDGNKNNEGRTLLQTFGTEIVRERYDRDYWVDYLITMIRASYDYGKRYDYVIIPDCRYKNEVSRWKNEGFDVYSIRRERNNIESSLTDEQKNHSSEISIKDIPYNYLCSAEHYSNLLYWCYKFCYNIENDLFDEDVKKGEAVFIE